MNMAKKKGVVDRLMAFSVKSGKWAGNPLKVNVRKIRRKRK
jgi:hypothetical protein